MQDISYEAASLLFRFDMYLTEVNKRGRHSAPKLNSTSLSLQSVQSA
jgi:hypothetical protein